MSCETRLGRCKVYIVPRMLIILQGFLPGYGLYVSKEIPPVHYSPPNGLDKHLANARAYSCILNP